MYKYGTRLSGLGYFSDKSGVVCSCLVLKETEGIVVYHILRISIFPSATNILQQHPNVISENRAN